MHTIYEDFIRLPSSVFYVSGRDFMEVGHVFQRTVIIFELSRGIITTTVPTKVFKRFYYSHTYVLTNFEHEKYIIGTTFLTKFHDNQAINVTFRVLTRNYVDDALMTNGYPKSTP
ncbi:hypothetical protein DPMN_115205 [Dreissena polymorpha]|uniref:Uncharacterized protein n=1 Tax=Dreissena polymorpha TaxID=45954 RepID=A0A9D4KKS6_DREPO|nr:hypothetical protein DPMN_115205 [Dreissena polymorpha]